MLFGHRVLMSLDSFNTPTVQCTGSVVLYSMDGVQKKARKNVWECTSMLKIITWPNPKTILTVQS